MPAFQTDVFVATTIYFEADDAAHAQRLVVALDIDHIAHDYVTLPGFPGAEMSPAVTFYPAGIKCACGRHVGRALPRMEHGDLLAEEATEQAYIAANAHKVAIVDEEPQPFTRFAAFVRDGAIDLLAWACVALLFAVWLIQQATP